MTHDARMPWAVVGACCLGMFAATASGSSRSPFLLDMAADFDVSLPLIANLFGVTSVCWGLSAYLAGRASDVIGRRVFLVGAPLLLATEIAAAATAQTYLLLAAYIAFAGLACGAFTASAMAEVSLRAPNEFRGRALGWVMSGQSLTLLIGVPTAAWLGAYVGWRGVHFALCGLAFLAAAVCFFVSRPSAGDPQATALQGHSSPPLREALNGPLVRLFGALIVERVCFGLSAFYYPAYLRTAYDLEIAQVALPLFGFALGNILGTIIGGQIADKLPNRRVSFGLMLLIAGVFAMVWFTWRPGLLGTALLGVGFSLFDAISRPPLLAAMADVPPEVRGLVMGLNSSIASIGWLTAALIGGWLYAGAGFGAFGPLMLVMCVVGALVVLPDSRIWKRT